MFADEL